VVSLSAVGLACLALPREEVLRLRVKMQNKCHVGIENEAMKQRERKPYKRADTKCPARRIGGPE
jgi:hypothetical protein